ncbi:MAG: nucleoside phosphorylase [Candidatus Aminicenantes bacterium]|nr:MAG: nucleoside phosphorylase [Candidatus Aminicenantes bacterium]
MPGEPMFKPKPLRGFSHRRAVYIPVDPPSRILWKALAKKASRDKDMPFGHVFLLDNTAVLYRCIGASSAVIGLEHLIASGAEEILILGFCGSLNPDFSAFDVVSINKAYSEEGTSKHYIARKKVFHPSNPLRQSIESRLVEWNLPFLQGFTVSTDAPYRETKSWLKEKQNNGIDVVDMEASAIFALGEYHDIMTAALMIVSDELTGKKWKNVFTYSRLNKLIKEYFLPFL